MGVVDWTSPTGVFTSFKEQGQVTVDNTSVTISCLTPSTEYTFTVVIITSEGQGAENTIVITTTEEDGGVCVSMSVNMNTINSCFFFPLLSTEKLVYFQIRIQGIEDCETWRVSLRHFLVL